MTDPIEKRKFATDLLRLLGWPLLLITVFLFWLQPGKVYTYKAVTPEELFAIITGTWDWASADSFCLANRHSLAFSTDRQVMFFRSLLPWTDSTGTVHRGATYDIIGQTDSTIRGRIRGESRLTAAGKPVEWDLVLTSRSSYAWHRTDWPPAERTKEVERCPQRTPTVPAPE